ncbi:MAG: isoprenoid biosynthesis glyoxalase ElbB [bacterium]
MKKVGLLLSGCGVLDGTEIHETVITILALQSRECVEVKFLAPNIEQSVVMNHRNNNPLLQERRNVLIESARIARGDIKDMKELNIKEIDGLIIPGGAGVILNLCTFANDGIKCRVNPDVEGLIVQCLEAKKPIGVLCIAPVLIAKILSQNNKRANLTIGKDPKIAEAIKKLGSTHILCETTDIVFDKENNILSTPAYMLGKDIHEVSKGITKLINKLLELL